MAQYGIYHKETLCGLFYVDADSKDEALEIYQNLVNDGKIDFGDLEMIDSSDTAVLLPDK